MSTFVLVSNRLRKRMRCQCNWSLTGCRCLLPQDPHRIGMFCLQLAVVRHHAACFCCANSHIETWMEAARAMLPHSVWLQCLQTAADALRFAVWIQQMPASDTWVESRSETQRIPSMLSIAPPHPPNTDWGTVNWFRLHSQYPSIHSQQRK